MSKSLSAALPLLLLILAATDVEASVSQTRGTVSSHSQVQRSKIGRLPFVVARGGATVTDEEDEVNLDEEDDDEEDDEDEKEDEELDPVMVKAAIKSSYKSKQKKTAAVKAKVSEKLASQKAPTKSTTPSKKKKSGSLWNKVPYIIRVCLNPFTVIAMTRAYFASLFNLNYLQVDKSQGLRSALEEKAKKSGSSTGGRTGKRQMKPGQAKTLSDLPQLNT